MFKVNTPDGEKYMVQLVGPRSYRMGGLKVMRGGTVTVAKKTRDYLVKTLNGAFVDYDPTPAMEVEELAFPQMGDQPSDLVDMADLDGKNNPALSQEQAAALALQGSEVGIEADALEAMTVAQLRSIATNAGVPLVGITKKADIVAALSVDTSDDISDLALGGVTAPATGDEGSGDLTGGDLPDKATKGGATAKTTLKVTGKPKPATAPVKAGAIEVA